MPQRWKSILLSLIAASFLFTACNRHYSSDDPLPATYTPSIIVGSDNQVVYALDPINGNKNWELTFAFPIKASPIVYGGMCYICSSKSDTVYKVNAKTGVVVKKFQPIVSRSTAIIATPVADANLLYVADTAGYLYAYDTAAGTLKWYYSSLIAEPIKASPVIYNGKIYYATTLGSVFCLDKTLGGIIPAGGSTPPIWSIANIAGASFTSSPAVSAPYLYLGSTSDSNLYCIYLDVPSTTTTGIIRWTYKTKGAIYSSPAAVAGAVVFGSNDFHVYCLDTTLPFAQTSPDVRWVDSTNAIVRSSPFIYNQVVYIGGDDYNLYALNIINGGVKWKFKSKGLIYSSPVAYKNTIYVGSYDKFLYAIDTGTGTAKWSKNINGEIFCSPVLDDLSKLTGYNSQISGFTN